MSTTASATVKCTVAGQVFEGTVFCVDPVTLSLVLSKCHMLVCLIYAVCRGALYCLCWQLVSSAVPFSHMTSLPLFDILLLLCSSRGWGWRFPYPQLVSDREAGGGPV
jgi:hypothetical protein